MNVVFIYLFFACPYVKLNSSMPKVSRRSCAVLNCSNSWYKIEKWMTQICNVHHCNFGTASCVCEPPFKLLPFPTERADPVGRLKWAASINRKSGSKNWRPNQESRICSKHFVDGNPTTFNPNPTLELGYKLESFEKPRRPPRQRSTTTSDINISIPSESADQEMETTNSCHTDHDYANFSETQVHEKELERENQILREKIQKLENEVIYYKTLSCRSNTRKTWGKEQFSIKTVLSNDQKCKFYTGIPTVEAFNIIFDIVQGKTDHIHYWKGPRKNCNPLKYKVHSRFRKLSKKQEFVLTLMKLRLGLLFQDLADRFSISTTHASNIFTTWIKILGEILGCLVFNPPKHIVQSNIPPVFKRQKKYRNVRHIIDCTEVFLEKPNNLQLAAQSWSDYKHHQTAKFLVSINPSGLINFVSECWGGRASDKHITSHSGFLDIVERNDTVMADRGFTIREELALIGAELFIPPGRRGACQMSRGEVKLTSEIANLRIYVEQAIRRMKTFRLLKYEVPLTLVHHLDNIVRVVAGICNLHFTLPKYT